MDYSKMMLRNSFFIPLLFLSLSLLFLVFKLSSPQLLRSLPRQTLNTITHILKRLLILLGRVPVALITLDLFAVIPLHLEGAEHDAGVEAVDVVARVAGEAGELLDELEEGVDVVAVCGLAL